MTARRPKIAATAPKPKRKAPMGRPPSTMTAAVCRAICGFVSDGLRFERAAVAAGVDAATARKHKSRNKPFDRHVALAESAYEVALLELIRAAAPKNWTAAAWLCERRWPEYYAPPGIQLNQTNIAVDASAIVQGIEAFLKLAEAKHNPPGALDVDAPKERK